MDVEARPLTLRLLGSFDLGNGARLSTRKAEALLAYLALPAGRPHRRDALMGLLWGDRGDKQARHSLSQTLFSLRRTLSEQGYGSDVLVADGDVVYLAPESTSVDVADFERLASLATVDDLTAAAALYRGELLQGLSLREFAFEEWLTAERHRLKEQAIGVFTRLVDLHEQEAALEKAIQAALRLVAIDSLQETGHRALMRLYLAQGRPAAALRQYEQCSALLERELGVEPEAETRALHREIVQRRATRASARTAPAVTPAAPAPEPVRPVPAKEFRVPADMVGRQEECTTLERWWSEVMEKRRKLVFIAGEAGIGKTTLIDAFVARTVDAHPQTPVGRGQCISHRGSPEPYLPVLEALAELCPAAPDILSCIRTHAPSWVAQLPCTAEGGGPAVEVAPGVTRERMLREMVEALEAAAAQRPLLLVLEDLHWSDHSTLDLLNALAYRRNPARLMVLATYREADVSEGSQPVHEAARTLSIRGLAERLSLSALDVAAVEGWLAARFPDAPPPAGLAAVLHRRAGGNPLFMLNLLEWWLDRGALSADKGRLVLNGDFQALEHGVPDSLGFLIEQQFERLADEERRILEAASVAGTEFSAASAAAGLGVPEDEVEDLLTGLARRGLFIRADGTLEWPDGTISSTFSFLHHLYRVGLYEHLPAGLRARLHRRIGERLEAAFATETVVPAAELAMHFREGRVGERAVRYLEEAAHQALYRSAHREAVGFLDQALALLPNVPEKDRSGWEIRLQRARAPALVATEGWCTEEGEKAYRRICDLCRTVGDHSGLSSAMFGLATLLEFRGEYRRTQDILRDRMAMLETYPDPAAIVESAELFACSTFHHAKFGEAVAHADRVVGAYDGERHRTLTASFGDNPAVSGHGWASRALWFLGRPEEARERCEEGLRIAQREGYTFALALAHEHMARLLQHLREVEACRDHAAQAMVLGEQYGFAYRVAAGTTLKGWADAFLGNPVEGRKTLEAGLDIVRRTGAALEYPYFLALLAEVLEQTGHVDEALPVLDEALRLSRGRHGFFYEAEILRLMGCMRLTQDPEDTDGRVEGILREALAVARRQQARTLEYKTALSLAHLHLHQGRKDDAVEILTAVDAGVPAVHSLPDADEARALLGRLVGSESRTAHG